VSAGNPRWLARRGITADGAGGVRAGGLVLVGVDGRLAGRIVLHDTVRTDAAASVTRLRAAGVVTVAMVTGDSVGGADAVARELGIDRVHADLTPQGKVDVVRAAQRAADGGTVVMVGDGINDAPALAAADVGVAMAAGGATVSSEAADVVIAIDRLDRVADAVEIGRRSLAIARQSVVAGMGLSIVAMAAAALGHIPPVAGAVLQEAIDVAVILNALRALRA
jgi:P-type E1-E2 ATPase